MNKRNEEKDKPMQCIVRNLNSSVAECHTQTYFPFERVSQNTAMDNLNNKKKGKKTHVFVSCSCCERVVW